MINSLWYDRLKEYKKDLNMLLGIYIYFWDFLKSYSFFCLIMIWLKFGCFFWIKFSLYLLRFILVFLCDIFFCSISQRNFFFITNNILYYGIKIIIDNFFMFSNYMFSVIFFLMKNTSTLFLNYITLNSLFLFLWSILINICSFLLFFLNLNSV